MANQETQAPPASLDVQLEAPGLVFMGIGVHWRRRLSDLSMNTVLAERWESQFQTWRISDREVNLTDSQNRYHAVLSDGVAQFLIESVAGYDLALEHASEVLQELPDLAKTKTRIETQYLLPSADSFEEKMSYLASKLLDVGLLKSLGGELHDFNYLSDVRIDDQWYQLNIGAVRDNEIRRRVRARHLIQLPPVATFCNIALIGMVIKSESDFRAAISQTLDVGRRITGELE